jgi:hypothetical protein
MNKKVGIKSLQRLTSGKRIKKGKKDYSMLVAA